VSLNGDQHIEFLGIYRLRRSSCIFADSAGFSSGFVESFSKLCVDFIEFVSNVITVGFEKIGCDSSRNFISVGLNYGLSGRGTCFLVEVFDSELVGEVSVGWRDPRGEKISLPANFLSVSFEGLCICILVSPNQRCYQQRKGPVRLSARDPSERFSTLLARLQSQQLAGVQCRSARYAFSGILALFQCEHSTD
jgi:hypothetical protein